MLNNVTFNKKIVKKIREEGLALFLVPTARGRIMHVSITKGAGNLGLSATQSVIVLLHYKSSLIG